MAGDEKKGAVKDFQDKHFFKVELAVQPDKIKEDKAYFLRTLRSGIELESANINLSDTEIARRLGADGNYNEINHWVQRVYCDGTIRPCGQEIVFKGSTECFDSYLKGLSDVEGKLRRMLTSGRHINNDSVSAHITLLTSQNKELPEAYVANYYQLYRKFCDALLWLSGSTYQPRNPEINPTPNPHWIVRSGLRQYANPLMMKSPANGTMAQISRNDSKYVGMYFKNSDGQQWLDNGSPNGLCVEFRFVDRISVPPALVAFKCLLQALLFKAVELSEFGVLNVEANGGDSWEKTKLMTTKISSGVALTDGDKQYLVEKSQMLIDFIYPNLRSFDGKSVEILRKLAVLPIHQRYAQGKTDDEIIKDLTPRKQAEYEKEREVRRIIQLQLVKQDTATEWSKKVGGMLGISERTIRHILTKLSGEYKLDFDREIKSYIIIG